MVDECKHCSVRGNFSACESTPCSLHTTWYASALKNRVEEKAEERAKAIAMDKLYGNLTREEYDRVIDMMSWDGDTKENLVDLKIRLAKQFPKILLILYKDWMSEVVALLREDKFISAIKLVRGYFGIGLKEAKAIVTDIREKQNL